jgi:hypothetical protein
MAKVPPKPSGKGLPPQPGEISGNLEKSEPSKPSNLNFKVPEAFKIEFRVYAAQQGKSLNRVLQDAFSALKNQSTNL